VLNRGNGRAEVFHKEEDYVAFLDLMAEAGERLPMRLLAWCLIPAHFPAAGTGSIGSTDRKARRNQQRCGSASNGERPTETSRGNMRPRSVWAWKQVFIRAAGHEPKEKSRMSPLFQNATSLGRRRVTAVVTPRNRYVTGTVRPWACYPR
jgi:hypothetical protein